MATLAGLVTPVAAQEHPNVHFVGLALQPSKIPFHAIPLSRIPGFLGIEPFVAVDDPLLGCL